MGVRVAEFDERGLVLRGWRGGRFTVAYGEVLTAERTRQSWRIVLHTVGMGEISLWCRGRRQPIEDELRRRGVRVVDCWGAIISPTLADFEQELDRERIRVRQSSDNA